MSNAIDAKWKKAMENAFKLLGSQVEVHVRVSQATAFDPIYNEPIDPEATAYTTKIVRIQGIFSWVRGFELLRLAPGTVRREQGVLHVRLIDVAKSPTDPSVGTIFDDAEKVVVDGVDCRVLTTARKGGISVPYNVIVTLERFV